jgi:hypothetical protein
LDNLVDTSGAIVDQIDLGIQFVGAMITYDGSYIAPANMQSAAYLTQEQADAYNSALTNLASFQPYTAVDFLNDAGENELAAMNAAVENFTEVVVDMSTVIQVSEMAAEAQETDNVQQQEDLQSFVSTNELSLQVTAEDVEEYNTSLDDVAEHAANAAAYLSVAGNEEAAAFIQEGADNAGESFNNPNNSLTFNHSSGMVAVMWESTNNGTGVFVNGQDAFGINVYLTDSAVLTEGSSSSFYLEGPTAQGYECFMYGTGCEYGEKQMAVNPGPGPESQ